MTQSLKDLLKVIRKRRRAKGARSLTIRGSTALPPTENDPSVGAIPLEDTTLPPKALPPDHLYPRGLNGGYLVWLEIKDDRARANRTKKRAVQLEMLPPNDERDFWYACKLELDSFEAAAVLRVAVSTFYRISRSFVSKREQGGRTFFVTEELYNIDVPRLDELVHRVEARTGYRAGKHSKSCQDHAHNGACQRGPKTSAGWTKTPRRQQRYTRCAPDAPPAAPPAEAQPDTRRQTFTEAAINATTSSHSVRETLYEEERKVIEAERAAGQFVPKDDEVV